MHEQLLAEMTWVRRLARALLKDVDAADDVAQDAWLVASEHAPDDRPLRPWLARVVLNLVRMRGRGANRRQLRELATGEDTAAVPTSAQLVERVEMQRVVAAEVVALAEPSRQTILLRYVEGLSSAEIARRLGIPDATVRRRLKRALDELRERLRARDDAPSGGWLAALAPLAHGPVAVGALTMKKLIAIVVAIVLMLLIAGGVWHARTNRGSGDDSTDLDRAANAGLATSADDPQHRRDRDRTIALPSWAAQAGVPPRRIAGRVVLGDKPVANATVRLGVNLAAPGGRRRANLGILPLTLVAILRTTASGTFDFGLQPAAAFVVSAEAANAAPASISVQLADPHVAPDHLVIALGDCRSRLSGIVRDSAAGIARARIQVAGLAGTDADASGHYTLCVPTMSSPTMLTGIRVDADGYGTIEMLLPSLFGDLHQDFVLVPEATMGGIVVDEAGAPVGAAGVIAEPIFGDDRHEAAMIVGTAEPDGGFQLTGLAPGRYLVHATAERSSTATPTAAIATAGVPTRDLRLVVSQRARLRGHVMMAGAPVAGATVITDRTNSRGQRVETALSQADGSFVLDVARGTVALVATPYAIRTPQSVVIDRADPADITIEVTPMATVRGHVTRHHEPVAGVTVGSSLDGSIGAVSGADGAYELDGVPAGTGDVHALDWKAFGIQRGVTTTLGATQIVDVELTSGGEIHGTVVDEAGAAVPGVYVHFVATDLDDNCQSMTDGSGGFACMTLAGGTDYQPMVYPSAGQQRRFHAASGDELARVHVADGDAVVSDVRLAIANDRWSIRGKVVDDSGAVVPDAHVSAGGPDPGIQPIRARADGDGGFIVENLARGSYTLRAHAPDGSEAEIAGVQTGTAEVRIVVARPGRIEGTLVGFATSPHVYAEQPLGTLDDPREAIVTGTTFTFAALPPGIYTVDAMVNGVQVTGAPADVRSGQTTRVTLEARPRATVDGRVTDLVTGAPIAGASCVARVSVAGSEAALFGTIAPPSQSDATGHFTVDAAVGRARITCKVPAASYSDAGGDFDVSGPTHVDVTAVKHLSQAGVGFRVGDWTVPATVISVDPGSPLATGDQILAIDGVSVANFVPDEVMTIAQNHRSGSTLVITTQRGNVPIAIH